MGYTGRVIVSSFIATPEFCPGIFALALSHVVLALGIIHFFVELVIQVTSQLHFVANVENRQPD